MGPETRLRGADSGRFGDRPSGVNRPEMLSPIATVEFSKLRHLGQSDRGAASSVLSHRRQPLWNQGSLESARPGFPGMVLAVHLIGHSSDDATRHPMSSKETAAQPAHQTRPLSRPEAYVALRLLPVCCVCGLVRDETDSSSHRTLWVTPGSYRRAHNVHSTDLRFTHTYCPDCFLQAQNRMREFFKEQDVSEDH